MATVSVPDYLTIVMDNVLDALSACFLAADLPVPADRFKYHGEPPWDCCDTLTIWTNRLRPTKAFPQPYGGPMQCEVTTVMECGVRLLRPC